MHRTTTATLLVTVAISALSGCVTVQRPTVPGPPPARSSPLAPHPDGSAEPRPVQAPAREALDLVEPSPAPSPPTGARHTTGPASPATPTAPSHDPSAPPHRRPGPRGPHIDVPPRATARIPRNADVCALGRQYGGWRPDSPESVICRRTYGR
ncbi:hypothetical protein AB0L85_21985 [Streptomyces sp. NPDC052051]|uniref:hypothetical protein n=1 Tax=Streptomyces sp. NPDC052051 TaxID=3154649 RepID=UPI003427A91C